jgi:ATPase subunit of ABC transporter with duplicated ATPase domains
LIRDAPILILDEPTSSIDSKTESVILDALENLVVGRTSFMIAHRLSTIRGADLIVVLNHGQVVEKGTHDELVALGGLYYQLYEAQTGRAAKIELEYAQAKAEGKSAAEAAEIAMNAGAAVESEAVDALAETIPAGDPAAPPANGEPSAPEPAQEPAPQPAPRPPVPVAAGPAGPAGEAVEPDVTEKVIETLENAVRQRVRAALEARQRERVESGTSPVAQQKAEHGGNGADSNGARTGPDGPAPSGFPAGDDAGM